MSEDVQPQPQPKRRPLAAAEAGARHLLLMIGFGVIAFVGGSIFMGSLVMRLAQRADMSWGPMAFIVVLLTNSGWVLAALPAIAYVSARFMELKAWPTAIIGAGSGLMFQLALFYVSDGENAIIGDKVLLLMRVVALGVGVFLTAAAVKRARAGAAEAEVKAKAQAAAKKTQYDEFVKQAEAMAERREQVPIAAAPDAPKPEDPSKPPEPPA
jgi:hypothetical protein